ncbi:hypothetical protein V2A60_002035 [Cordyceps javanica]|uniref:Uncharacterized protein n=1 Tax=Cordyceps javanica TaxID=43265 RepID=A0A545VH16_9HYPO|nr:hypothetical protein IF1G_00948 [Cordyceps javanica]TQW12176.1 hypothetical protein IF2G_00907 [Cordyceps javanica]
MAESDSSSSPPARAEQRATTSPEALAEIIAAQTQPDDATHLSLPGSEYLAAGDFHISEDIQQHQAARTSPPPGARVYTRTVHLETAHTRLQDILAETDDEHAERYSVTQSDDGLDDETRQLEEEVYVKRETMSIEWLRERNVPLLYDPKLLLRVHKQPDRYMGMLRPFYLHPPLDFDAPLINFFERQCLRFEEFNRWQAYNRDIDTMQEEIMNKAYNAALVREATSGREWQQLMANPRLVHSAARQEEFWQRRREERELLHDDDCADFEQYQAGVRARLARNGVEVPLDFALRMDFWAQDRLTVWAEYLAFEHWHMEQYDDDVAEWRAKHNVSYEQLQQKVALRTHETAEYLQTEHAELQLRVEKDRAFERFDMAALTFARLERRPRGLRHEQMFMSHIRRTRMLAEAQVELETAEAAKNEAVRRYEVVAEFLHETETYREACDIRARHDPLLAWAKDRYYEIRSEAGQLSPPGVPLVAFLQPQARLADDAATSQGAVVAAGRQQSAAEAGANSQEGHRSDVGTSWKEEGLFSAVLMTPPAAASPHVSLAPVSLPSVETRSEQSHAVETPAAEQPLSEQSSKKQSSVEKSSVEQSSVEQSSVEQSSVEQSSVEQSSIEQPAVNLHAADSPSNQLSPVEQPEGAPMASMQTTEPPVSIVATEIDAVTSVPNLPGPRRSARIAAMRQKAAEQAVLQNTQARAGSESRAQRASRGSGRKRGRGKVAAAEEEAQDEPPAKRPRRRAAKK